MPDLSNVNLWAAAISIVLASVVSAIVALRAAASKASQEGLNTLRASYVSLQETYLKENERLNAEIVSLRNQNDALLNKQVVDKAECLRQIIALQVSNAELQRQLTQVLTMMPNNETVRKVVIVGAEIPKDAEGKAVSSLPVNLEGPIPLPTTAELKAAAAAAVAADVANGTVQPPR